MGAGVPRSEGGRGGMRTEGPSLTIFVTDNHLGPAFHKSSHDPGSDTAPAPGHHDHLSGIARSRGHSASVALPAPHSGPLSTGLRPLSTTPALPLRDPRSQSQTDRESY